MEINSGNRDLGTTMCASGYNKDFGFHYQKGGYLELVLTSLSCYLNRFVLRQYQGSASPQPFNVILRVRSVRLFDC